jgi:hypothetical protein
MNRLASLGLFLLLTSCGHDPTALDPHDGGSGTGGGGDSSGGSGGAGRGHPDGSIEVTGGTGGDGGATGGSPGTGGATGGTGGATGGTGGAIGPDAGTTDAQPKTDAGDLCQMCAGFATEYAGAIRMEQACTPGATGQCLKQTPGQLTCGCPVWVNTTVLSDAVRMRYQASGCQKCTPFMPCPAIACVNPGAAATCVPVAAAGDPGGATPIVAPPQRGQCMAKF